VKLALNYDNVSWGCAVLYPVTMSGGTGSESTAARDTGMIGICIELALKSFYKLTPELFFSAHNLFNGVQTRIPSYTQCQALVEGGRRVKFDGGAWAWHSRRALWFLIGRAYDLLVLQ